ncbi:uncharacterized protein BJ212DRAFT_1518133 [Suillus subaureus]|uniref:Uncharacterized protein n=1 Tax=Suillus subaureus TaxID=48587 RepID=A0A9P7E7D0_9AGAM|nr:uncharacterized protein BJ212DRAFT_1518133 [Suillus subaureus]KAG1812899.1 hypothetical protein BJ212DRAFT_1518133 [Suillus subaureus]
MLETTLDHLNSAFIVRHTYEFIIVDHGLKDNTSALVLKLAQQHLNNDIRVVTLEKESWQGRYTVGCYMHVETGY